MITTLFLIYTQICLQNLVDKTSLKKNFTIIFKDSLYVFFMNFVYKQLNLV